MKRLAALVAATAMVAGAIAIRSHLDDGGGSGGGGGPVRIACVRELEEACRSIASADVRVVVEDAGTTADAAAAGASDADLWLTFEPWAGVVDEAARRRTVKDVAVLGSSALELGVVSERAPALASACGGAITWRCLGDRLGAPWTDLGGKAEWGALRIGLPSTRSGIGLLLYGAAVAGWFGRTDIGVNDFDDQLVLWQSSIRRSFSDDALVRFAQQFPAAYAAVGLAEAQRPVLGGRLGQVTFVAPGGPVHVAVALVGLRRSARDAGVLDKARAAVQAAGWDGPAEPSSGLPSAGLLLALRDQ